MADPVTTLADTAGKILIDTPAVESSRTFGQLAKETLQAIINGNVNSLPAFEFFMLVGSFIILIIFIIIVARHFKSQLEAKDKMIKEQNDALTRSYQDSSEAQEHIYNQLKDLGEKYQNNLINIHTQYTNDHTNLVSSLTALSVHIRTMQLSISQLLGIMAGNNFHQPNTFTLEKKVTILDNDSNLTT